MSQDFSLQLGESVLLYSTVGLCIFHSGIYVEVVKALLRRFFFAFIYVHRDSTFDQFFKLFALNLLY